MKNFEPIPEEYVEEAQKYRQILLEAVAESDDDLMENIWKAKT